jgi:ribonuclease-3
MPKLGELETKLGYRFANQDLLKQAIVHRSYLNEHPEIGVDNNERLEFLGDAVLELGITEYLYAQYPERSEGELTAFRAALVNADTLSRVAAGLALGDFLLLSRGEARDAGRARQTILANACEALIGALYLDGGYEPAKNFIAAHLFPLTETVVAENLWQDPKSLFQERAQAAREVTPAYRLIEANGPDHDKIFKVGVYLGDELVAEGEGPSKQRAEQDAARAGLQKMGWE